MANTGNKIYTTLLKVVNGGINDGQPLDINNNLTSASGLPQASKSNTFGQPDYVAPVSDPTNCPLPSGGSYVVTGGVIEDPISTNSLEVTAFISNALTVDIVVTLQYNETFNGSTTAYTTTVAIVAGTTDTSISSAILKTNATATIDYTGVQSVTPNPAGGVTLTF